MSYFDYGIKGVLIFFYLNTVDATMFHGKERFLEENIAPFDELILTWNGKRPTSGNYFFYIRLKTDVWLPYLLYACWGADGQSSFSEGQDIVRVSGQKATGFEVEVRASGGAPLEDLRSLHVYVNQENPQNQASILSDARLGLIDLGGSHSGPSEELPNSPNQPPRSIESILLDVPGLSQRTLSHPRAKDLCSPTSTSVVVRYLAKHYVDALEFAGHSWDGGFDIFGNWVFNVAHASSLLGPSWNCWVQRLQNFDDIYTRLQKKTPVIVSVRGPLQGSALPYSQGHLMVVIGFDAVNERVLCMDPAFPTNKETLTSYPLQDFIDAWSRRGFISYIFEQVLR